MYSGLMKTEKYFLDESASDDQIPKDALHNLDMKTKSPEDWNQPRNFDDSNDISTNQKTEKKRDFKNDLIYRFFEPINPYGFEIADLKDKLIEEIKGLRNYIEKDKSFTQDAEERKIRANLANEEIKNREIWIEYMDKFILEPLYDPTEDMKRNALPKIERVNKILGDQKNPNAN